MKNVLWYLGFLSALSLLYFVDGDWLFLCWLGFAPYFATYWAKDERVELNEGRATRNAVLWVMFSGAVVIIYRAIAQNPHPMSLNWAFVLLWSGSFFVCFFSFVYYDFTGR